MRDDIDTLFTGDYSTQYEGDFYKGPIGYVMKKGHHLLENMVKPSLQFSKILEIGAGLGNHVPFVKHGYSEYYVTDNSERMLELLASNITDPRVKFFKADAATLPFDSGSIDRIVACHVLEHLPNPHQILREWDRVVKPGGLISLVLPCDPGIAWRYGRYISSHRTNMARGILWGYMIAREHINPINNLVALIRYYFGKINEKWWPFGLPNIDVNLLYVVNIWK